MKDTSVVYAQIDTKLKEEAEAILAKLGVSPADAIQMFYSQVVLTKGMPFDLRLQKTTAIGGMSQEQLDVELLKGWQSLRYDRAYTVDEVDEELKREFGI